MGATEIMVIAMLLALLGRWAHNEKAVPSAQGLIEIIFALIVIAALDHGSTEPIAKGFAWLFLAAVLLSDKSILTGLAIKANVSDIAAGGVAGAAAGKK